MKILFQRLTCLTIILTFSVRNTLAGSSEAERIISKICFGSCLKVSRPQPVWKAINSLKPDLFIFLGDNVYADTDDPVRLRKSWEKLGNQPGYQKLREQTIVHAIWDDHDYGKNDAGKEFVIKQESQQIFLDFFGEPKNSIRRKTKGIYGEKFLGPPDKKIQLILLDTRFFRDPLLRAPKRPKGKGPYQPTVDPKATLLGNKQWKWLEKCLKKSAKLRIIASSIQFHSANHGWETWGNFPNERQKLLEMLANSEVDKVLFLSGDRHSAEFSKIDNILPHPIWDVTSSSLNLALSSREEKNELRVGKQIFVENFGLLEIKWNESNPSVNASILDVSGNVLASHKIIGGQ